MKVALYLRVSTQDQSLELQRQELEFYCKLKGWNSIQVFSDHGVSGAKQSRPAFDQMMAGVRSGEIKTVVVWKFDRASRSTRHLIELMEEFKERMVDFVSVREQVDTSTPAGKLVFTIFGAMAEFERAVIIDRVKSGMAAAKRNGKHVARPRNVNWDAVQNARRGGMDFSEIANSFGITHQHARTICKKGKVA